MTNIVVLTGRLTKDPEMYNSKDGKPIAKMNIATDRGFGENKKTNYIPVTAFGKTAEFCEKYVGKGRLVAVEGEISTGSHQKQDGTTSYTFEVIASKLETLDKPKEGAGAPNKVSGFTEVEADCPF